MSEILLADHCIIDCLKINYGIPVAKLILLPLGADLNASVYKAVAHDQSSYFVKLRRGHHTDLSAAIITLLRNAGIQHVIPPIKNGRGHPLQHIDDCTLIVYPFVEGQDGFSRHLTNNQWTLLGKVMRQIHEINVPSSVQQTIRRESYSSKWREAIRSLYAHMEFEPVIDEIAEKLTLFMKNHATMIYRLVDRAEQLGCEIQNQSPKFVLCHSDIHAGNVLMDKNDVIYMVDWDDPVMAPKERDLMFIGGGIANTWNKPLEEEFFYQGYGHTEINRTILAYYRHERIVEDIAVLGQQLLQTSGSIQSRTESYNHFLAQFDLHGVIEIAFKTDELF
ncbi:MAG TPA: aminoglycoside phosphotransferase family protein [Gammaproteobacteria bacterium]|nr:aminoglycoside phosphotransferase family protein [Gammaproteobacteria bacterium]